MKISKFLYRINSNLTLFKVDIEKQRNFLNSFPAPIDTISRSYYQYKCQKFLERRMLNLIKDFIAFWALIPFILFLLTKSKINYSSIKNINLGVILFSGVDNIIPNDLRNSFQQLKTVDFGKDYFLIWKDISFVGKLLKRYYLSPYFLLKSTYKIAIYRSVIYQYNPKSIICSSEYSYTSSLLTAYCERNSLIHINVMHGDKLFNIWDSFFKFHHCYVWDEHYVGLLSSLRADPNQFIIAIPPSLMIKTDNRLSPIYEYTYYLGEESDDEMQQIKVAFLSTKYDPAKICIRYHPRFSDKKRVSSIFEKFNIENPLKCSLVESFSMTKRIVSLYSTVLYQGYMMNKQVVLDDLSQHEKYLKLKELKYIMISKEHTKFSEINDL